MEETSRPPVGVVGDGVGVVSDGEGVVGDDGESVPAAVADAGGRPVTGDAGRVLAADPTAVVAVGEPALLALARELPSAPILPVEAGRGVRSVPADAVEAAVGRLLSGEAATERRPVLAVERTGGERDLALLDAMVVTAHPADISEFSVSAAGERVARFRSDGVVAATPAGSAGYARAAGGPTVGPGSEVLGVVPVAPFATNADRWVLPIDEVTVTVERDEAAVEVLVDDRTVGTLGVDESIRLSTAGYVDTVRVPEGVSPFEHAELEKL